MTHCWTLASLEEALGVSHRQIHPCRASLELLAFLDRHRQAAQDNLEPGIGKLTQEAAVFLCANLDALYYDLFQFCLRCGGRGAHNPSST